MTIDDGFVKMKKYMYMSPDNKISLSKVKERIKAEYDIEMSDALLKADNSVFKSHIEKIISNRTCKKQLLEIAESISTKNNKKEALLLIEKLTKVLSDSLNYWEDITAACYIGILYSDKKMDSFKIEQPSEHELHENKEAQLLINDYKRKIEQINSVWIRKSNNGKINKYEARKNYPIPLIKSDDAMVDEGVAIIKSLPGGCLEYHFTMISMQNIGIFDTQSSLTSYRKYTFMKMYDIYRTLKDTAIENRLLMEFSLGIGYTNQIYHYLRMVTAYETIEKMEEIITIGANISPFFIRSKVIPLVWEYLKLKSYSDSAVQLAANILKIVQQYITEIFEKMMDLCWYEYFFYETAEIRYNMSLLMDSSWAKYFKMEEAYDDWVDFCGINNWSQTESDEDLFCHIYNFSNFFKYRKTV